MRRTAASRLSFAALLAACAVTACSIITSYDGLEGAPRGDAAVAPMTDTGAPDVVAEAAPVDPCTVEGVPPPPDAAAVTGNVGDLVAAVSMITLVGGGDGGPASAVGLNLDVTCGQSCLSSAAAPPKDPPTGIDNAAYGLFELLRSQGANINDLAFNDGIKAGLWGLVLRLSGYSGAPDDDAVLLDLMNSGEVNSGDGGARLSGTDEWSLDPANVVGGVPLFRSKVAYVHDNVLVARFERYVPTLRASGGGSLVLLMNPEIFSVTVTAKIVSHADGGMTLANGVLAGAMPAEQLLLVIQRLGTCPSDQLFPTVQDYVCGQRDLGPVLSGSPGDKCTRISIAFGFDAIPARIGTGSKKVDDKPGCDGGDPSVGCGAR